MMEWLGMTNMAWFGLGIYITGCYLLVWGGFGWWRPSRLTKHTNEWSIIFGTWCCLIGIFIVILSEKPL